MGRPENPQARMRRMGRRACTTRRGRWFFENIIKPLRIVSEGSVADFVLVFAPVRLGLQYSH